MQGDPLLVVEGGMVPLALSSVVVVDKPYRLACAVACLVPVAGPLYLALTGPYDFGTGISIGVPVAGLSLTLVVSLDVVAVAFGLKRVFGSLTHGTSTTSAPQLLLVAAAILLVPPALALLIVSLLDSVAR